MFSTKLNKLFNIINFLKNNKMIDWGVPTNRKSSTKVEKFNTPVVTMSALLGKGSGRKFTFNKAAIDALGLVSPDKETGAQSYVTFGRNAETGDVVLMALAEENENMKAFKTNKSYSFSDKKTYEFLTNSFSLNNDVENYLHFDTVENQPYFMVTSATNDNTVVEQAPVVEETPVAQVESNEEEEIVSDANSYQSVTNTVEEEEIVDDQW